MSQIVAPKIVLPTKKSTVDNNWIDQKTGMIGPAGIGKSKFWSYSNGLYIQTEAGLNHLEVFKVVCRSWDDFKEIYTQLLHTSQNGSFQYDTIIIDTIDRFIDLIHEEVIARGRAKFKAIEINSIGDVPNGAGWAWATELMENALSKLESLPAHIVYIGHLEQKEIKEPTRSIHKATISIGGKMGGNLVAWPDHLLNIDASFQGSKIVRKVRTLPTASIEAKSRGGVVKDGWVWEESDEANFKTFRGLFK